TCIFPPYGRAVTGAAATPYDVAVAGRSRRGAAGSPRVKGVIGSGDGCGPRGADGPGGADGRRCADGPGGADRVPAPGADGALDADGARARDAVRLGPAAADRCRRRIHLDHDPDVDRSRRRPPEPGLALRRETLAAHRAAIRARLAE